MQKPENLKRSICFCSSPFSHLLDHLAPIAHIFNIPLIVTDENIYELACKYYPFVKVIHVSEKDCSLTFLAENFDTIFLSCKHWSRDLALSIKKLLNKDMRFFYVPHGNSDKGHIDPNEDLLMNQDLTLLYGSHMQDMLHKRGVLATLNGFVTVGNFRHLCYLKHNEFYDDIVEKEIFSKFEKKQTTLLYAPTWKDPEDSSSFFHVCENMLKTLPDHFNLLIKLHPKIEEENPAKLYYYMGKYAKPNVIFVPNSPIVYPILARSDVYIGDFSSIGYDMLIFDKPMYFLNPKKRNPKKDDGLFLFQTGLEIPQKSYEKMFLFIESTLQKNTKEHKEARKKILEYTFEKGIDFKKITTQVEILIQKTNPLFLESTKTQ